MSTVTRPATRARAGRVSRWIWDLLLATFLVVVFAYAIYASSAFGDARLFPLAIAVPSLVLATLQVAISLRAHLTARTDERAAEAEELPVDERLRRTLEIGAWILGIFVGVWLVGFHVAIVVAAVAYTRRAGEGWAPSLLVAALCLALVYGVFDRLLHVPLPPGELVRLLSPR